MGIDAKMLFRIPATAADPMYPARMEEFERRLRDLLCNDKLGVVPVREASAYCVEEAGYDVFEVWTYFRYWGRDYERGPLAEILFILDFTEAYFAPHVRVFYGPDSADALPEWNASRRTELLSRACSYKVSASD